MITAENITDEQIRELRDELVSDAECMLLGWDREAFLLLALHALDQAGGPYDLQRSVSDALRSVCECGCAETYPQLEPGRLSHGGGCARRDEARIVRARCAEILEARRKAVQP